MVPKTYDISMVHVCSYITRIMLTGCGRSTDVLLFCIPIGDRLYFLAFGV